MGGRIDINSEEARERLFRVFRHAQVGRSVSSVTHDLNNFLGAIMAYAELCSMDSGVSADTIRMLTEITNAVKKSSTLVNSLTDVARKERQDVRVLGPSQLVDRVLDLRRYDLRVANVALDTSYGENLPMLSVNLPRLQLALMYLVSNTIEALDGKERKRLKASVQRDGSIVTISMKDSAEPIPEEIREQIFDPFFTTKSVDHLGLGLTAARAALEDHGGTLSYSPDQGFVATLPLVTKYV